MMERNAQVGDWDLSGTVFGSFGPASGSASATGLLTLNPDRTYVLAAEGDDAPETGVWFQDRGRLLLFQQNLLEQLALLEQQLTDQLGTETVVSILSVKTGASFKKGGLSLNEKAKFNAYFPSLGLTVGLSSGARLTGTQVPISPGRVEDRRGDP